MLGLMELWSRLIIFSSLIAYSSCKECPSWKYDCLNGRCIRGTLWCDGNDNCGNGADETTCKMCFGGAFKCVTQSQCLPPQARCNGVKECNDGSDEQGCIVPGNHTQDIMSSSMCSSVHHFRLRAVIFKMLFIVFQNLS